MKRSAWYLLVAWLCGIWIVAGCFRVGDSSDPLSPGDESFDNDTGSDDTETVLDSDTGSGGDSDSGTGSGDDSGTGNGSDSDSVLPVCFSSEGISFTSARDGAWWDSATWDPPGVPTCGDQVAVSHHVTVDADTFAGASLPAGGDAAIIIEETGTLTVAENVTLVSQGDLRASGTVTLRAGARLVMDSSQAPAPQSTVYLIEIKPGTTAAHLQIDGTASNRCYVGAHPGGAHTRITDGDVADGGRVVASHCDFERLGGPPDYRAYQYNFASTALPYSFEDCTFDHSSQLKYNLSFGMNPGGEIRFERCRWSNSVVKPAEELGQWEEWYILETWSAPGVSSTLRKCDFDRQVGLFAPDDMIIEDNVFREGVQNYSNGIFGGQWQSFKRNFVHHIHTGLSINYGSTVEDNVFMYDDGLAPWNPHFGSISGRTGAVSVKGNVFWWNGTSPAAEGDGFIIDGADTGTRAENTITFENNLLLPNGNGPDAVNNLSCSGFTILTTSSNKQVDFRNNTLHTGTGFGGINLGETNPTTAHDVVRITGNIFVGGSDGDGMKVLDLGHSVTDTFLAENVDYNAGYRIADGALFGNGSNSAKGYSSFVFSGGIAPVGAHDLDDEDPLFVDPTRTPVSWSGSADATMDRLAPGGGYSMADLLSYIREGFRPTNETLRGAGDPSDGSPDLGAVPLE